MNRTRISYPCDVSDSEWEFLLRYLTLMARVLHSANILLRPSVESQFVTWSVRASGGDSCRMTFRLRPQSTNKSVVGCRPVSSSKSRMNRLARDYERLTQTLEGWHWLAFVALLLANAGLKSAEQALEK